MNETQKKPIDKEYLKSSLADFDSQVLSRTYLRSGEESLHSHANREVLDKLNVSEDHTLLFDGNEINGGSTPADLAKLQNQIDRINTQITDTDALLENTLKKSDVISSLSITDTGKIMDGKTCADGIGKALGTTLTATLEAGAAALTFTDASITDDSLIEIYTDVYGVSPSAVEQSGNTLTVTFDAKETNIQVKVRVM